MKKPRFTAVLLLIIMLAGCGQQATSSNGDTQIPPFSTQETVKLVYDYAISQIENAGNRKIAASMEGTITPDNNDKDRCYSIRISEETSDQSLTLNYYAISINGPYIYRMDPTTGEYARCCEISR